MSELDDGPHPSRAVPIWIVRQRSQWMMDGWENALLSGGKVDGDAGSAFEEKV